VGTSREACSKVHGVSGRVDCYLVWIEEPMKRMSVEER
jgi:hypothetical protein